MKILGFISFFFYQGNRLNTENGGPKALRDLSGVKLTFEVPIYNTIKEVLFKKSQEIEYIYLVDVCGDYICISSQSVH